MKTTVTMPGAANCYIIKGDDGILLIDPGTEYDETEASTEGLPVKKVILTHGHADHIWAAKHFRDKYGATVCIHEKDEPYLTDISLSDPVGFNLPLQELKADVLLKDGDTVAFAPYVFTVIHTPGHTPGSICLKSGNILFSGDTLFSDGIGRTDFPGSNAADMKKSLLRLFEFPGDIRVYPGHGYPTSIENEKNNIRYYI